MIERRVSLPPDVDAALLKRAHDAGFYGPAAASAYIRHVVAESLGMGAGIIVVKPTSPEQRQWLADYAVLKNHASLEAFVLYAAGAMTKKAPLTEAEQAEYERIVADRRRA